MWRRVQAEAGVQEESVWHAWGCTVAEWNQIPGVLLLFQRTGIVSSQNMLGLWHEFVRSLSSPTGEITIYSPWIYSILPRHKGGNLPKLFWLCKSPVLCHPRPHWWAGLPEMWMWEREGSKGIDKLWLPVEVEVSLKYSTGLQHPLKISFAFSCQDGWDGWWGRGSERGILLFLPHAGWASQFLSSTFSHSMKYG